MGEFPNERDEIIATLVRNNVRLFPALLSEISECCGFDLTLSDNLSEIYGAFNDHGLHMVYRCFVKKETDLGEQFMQYRLVQWLAQRHKQMHTIDFGRKISTIGGIDVVGYDKNGDIIVVAECRCGKERVKEEDLDKWIENVKLLKQAIADKLKMAYFVDNSGYRQEAIDRLFRRKDITRDGRLKTGIIGKVSLCLCEEHEGEIKPLKIT